MTYSRTEIMKRAWAIYRDEMGAPGAWAFRHALKKVWNEAKYAARVNAQSAEVSQLREAITVLECKTRFAPQDHARLADLRLELAQAA